MTCTENETNRRPLLVWIICLVAALIAAAGSSIVLRNGIRLTPDSWSYWQGAVSLMDGRGYNEFSGRPVWSWPPGYSVYLLVCQKIGGVSGRTLALGNVALAAAATFTWSLAFILPYRKSIQDDYAHRRLSLVIPLLAVLFIACTLVGGFRSLMSQNLSYVFFPLALSVTAYCWRAPLTTASALLWTTVNVILLSLLALSHNSMMFLAPLAALLLLFVPARRLTLRLGVAITTGVLPPLFWLIDKRLLGQMNSHKAGLHPLYSPREYAHQVLLGIAKLFGPMSHHLGHILLALICLVLAMGLLGNRSKNHSGHSAMRVYLLLSGGFLFVLYCLFNMTFIYEDLSSDRFMLFAPLTLFPAAVMLCWSRMRESTLVSSPQESSIVRNGAWKAAVITLFLIVSGAALVRVVQRAREARVNGGPVTPARVAWDRGFAYNRLTLRSNYPAGPVLESGKLILVPPYVEPMGNPDKPAVRRHKP